MAKKSDGSIESPMARRTPDRRRAKRPAEVPAQAPDKGGVSVRAGRKATTAARIPTTAEVQLLAYEIYMERGGGDGLDVEDWLEAERRLKG